jgi:hypothetical protein
MYSTVEGDAWLRVCSDWQLQRRELVEVLLKGDVLILSSSSFVSTAK